MLLQVPDELLLAIIERISGNTKSEPLAYLQSLACTCRRLYRIVIPCYYRQLAKARRCDPVTAAATRGNYYAVETLLAEGCSPGSKEPGSKEKKLDQGKKRYTRPNALIAAIEKRRADIACLVLEHGADPNADAGKIGNALEAACNMRMTEVVRALLRHGAAVHPCRESCCTALHTATQRGFVEIVELLLDNVEAAELDAGSLGHILQVAAASGHLECVKLLVERGTDVNVRGSPFNGRALEAALDAGHKDIVRFLFEQGAEDQLVKGLDDNWLPGAAFSIASKEEATEWHDVLATILERMDYSSQLAGNALVSVARDGNEHLVDHFLRKGVNVEEHGARAVGVAAMKGHLHILQRLVAAGVDLNKPVPKRGHAILRAAKSGSLECVRFLIEKGASPNIVDGTPYFQRAVICSTPLQVACWANGYQSSEIRHKFKEMARLFLEAGADPNVSGGRWFHPLNLAAYQGNESTVGLLLKHGANPSERGPVYGDNALQAAAIRGNIDIVKILLEHGAEIDGSGALEAACGAQWGSDANLELVKLLLDHGADPNHKSDAYAICGYINAMAGTAPGTVFWSAAECVRRKTPKTPKNDSIIQLLLDHGAL